MTQTIVYVVRADHGHYSDHTKWDVVAYREDDLAIRHAELAQAEAERIAEQSREEMACENEKNRYDPNVPEHSWEAPTYSVIELDVMDTAYLNALQKGD